MRTGTIAAEAGVNVQTLRYYERRGILPRPRRTASGYRAYGPDAVQLIRFVKRAQELGFTLDEVGELLRLRDGGRASCAEVKVAARAKLAAVDAKLAALAAMRGALSTLVSACDRNVRRRSCPLIETLAGPSRGRR
jgi:Hg(II)-responsive transcriptional regulator